MIHLVFCTDSLDDPVYFMQGIDKFRAKHKRIEFTTRRLSSNETCKELKRVTKASIFFLDNDMLPDHGLSLAQRIRSCEPDAIIIFLSSTKDLAFDAFTLHVHRYLLKPLKMKHLFEALDHSIAYISNIQRKHLGIKTGNGLVKVTYDQINHIESCNRVFFAHCKNGRVYRSISLRESFERTFETLLSDPRFVQTHKSFIVNMGLVRTIKSQDVIMQNGLIVPISQARYGHVRSEYRIYLGLNETEAIDLK